LLRRDLRESLDDMRRRADLRVPSSEIDERFAALLSGYGHASEERGEVLRR
jgi:hypothetical protein